MTEREEATKTVKIDHLDPIEVRVRDFGNEINTLRTLYHGLEQLCTMVRQKEVALQSSIGEKNRYFQFGATSQAEREYVDKITCFFHWFGISVCNFSRLVGFIRGISRGEFTRADLRDKAQFKRVTESIDLYANGVSELENVRVWRNKVFAHFALTAPRNENIATLDMSVIHPVTFEGRYFVGGLTMRRKNSTGTHVSQLPRWSMTEVFESLIPRYFPNVGFVTPEAESLADGTLSPEQAIQDYRRLNAYLEKMSEERKKLEAEAEVMKQKWKDWKGEDTLHATAFGEPIE